MQCDLQELNEKERPKAKKPQPQTTKTPNPRKQAPTNYFLIKNEQLHC